MNRKAGAIIGGICVIIGLIFWTAVQGETAKHYNHTFTAPYTQYEAGILLGRCFAIVLLVSGAAVLAIVLISIACEERNIQIPSGVEGSRMQPFSTCPGLRVKEREN